GVWSGFSQRCIAAVCSADRRLSSRARRVFRERHLWNRRRNERRTGFCVVRHTMGGRGRGGLGIRRLFRVRSPRAGTGSCSRAEVRAMTPRWSLVPAALAAMIFFVKDPIRAGGPDAGVSSAKEVLAWAEGVLKKSRSQATDGVMLDESGN